MKVIRYTLLRNGKVPSSMIDGGYFPKLTKNGSPQDYDLIGLSLGWTGLEEYKNKADLETYLNSFITDYINPLNGHITLKQDRIDNIWNKSL